MKNEVKKKMMIESRKLSHQSHDERISSTNVNHYFAENVREIPSCELVDRTMTRNFQLHERQSVQKQKSDVGRCADSREANSGACSSIMKTRNLREEPDSWPLLTMLSSSPAVAFRLENFRAVSVISVRRSWEPWWCAKR